MCIYAYILDKIGKFVNTMANLYNYCMKMSAKDLVKLLLSKEDITQKKLSELLSENTGKKYTPDGLSRKLNRDTITYKEVSLIIDLLGYEINIDKK